MITVCRAEDRSQGRELKTQPIESVRTGVSKALTEITIPGGTLQKRAADVPAHFNAAGTSNGSTEANGRA